MMISRRRLLGTAAASAAGLRAGTARALQATLPMYLYPPSHRYPDGKTLTAMTAFDVAQITTRFELPPEMAGVAIAFYWSTLSSVRGTVDFSMIDAALDYWGRRGKKVIVGVGTIGFPAHVGGRTARCGPRRRTGCWTTSRPIATRRW